MDDPLSVTDAIRLDPDEIELRFIRSSGPGGQNVNKLATAVQLRFDLMGSPSLPAPLKARAAALAGARLTRQGEIVLTASSFRTQERNRADAIFRLVSLLRTAAKGRKRRVPTRPTLASKTRRADAKTRRGALKRLRGGKPGLD